MAVHKWLSLLLCPAVKNLGLLSLSKGVCNILVQIHIEIEQNYLHQIQKMVKRNSAGAARAPVPTDGCDAC